MNRKGLKLEQVVIESPIALNWLLLEYFATRDSDPSFENMADSQKHLERRNFYLERKNI